MSKETLEELSEIAWNNYEHEEGNLYSTSFKNGFLLGAKCQQEKSYSYDFELVKKEVLKRFKGAPNGVAGVVILKTIEVLKEFYGIEIVEI